MTPIEQAKAALEFIQHLHSCEDEGMASGQPSKEDYLKAREITDDALSALSTIEGSAEPVAGGPLYSFTPEGTDVQLTLYPDHDHDGGFYISWMDSGERWSTKLGWADVMICIAKEHAPSDVSLRLESQISLAHRSGVFIPHPSPSLSVDEVMEVVKEELRESEGGIVLGWCIDEDTSSVEALDTAIRERLTKAITRP